MGATENGQSPVMNGAGTAEEIFGRLWTVLEALRDQDVTQQMISQSIGVSSQYLSDVKARRKPVTELFARRLAEFYHFDYRWLVTGAGQPPALLKSDFRRSISAPTGSDLPVFGHPISGDPWSHEDFDGSVIDLSGAAIVHAKSAVQPYVLRFEAKILDGRLRQKDLILISQKADLGAAFHVVQVGDKCFLARRLANGTWTRLATGKKLGESARPVGHCLGIIWGRL